MPIMARMKDELTSIHLPFDFDSNGNALTACSIAGNTQQSGTPSPQSIIMPTFCGVRTENLFDTSTATLGKYINSQGVETASTAPEQIDRLNHTDYIEIQPNTDYTYHYKFRYGVSNTIALCWFDASKNLISRVAKDVGQSQKEYILTGTSPVNAAFCIINFTGYLPNESMELSFNIGSTALPYEPYGWAEKITSAGQTQTVYLGQVQTVRRVRKLVLDGTEEWLIATQSGHNAAVLRLNPIGIDSSILHKYGICTHYPVAYNNNDGYARILNNGNNLRIMDDLRAVDKTAWKSYLADQYAAGTPVTVWYVLATPTTGVVNEPLAKIGDYSDELHSEDAGITIPTVRGSNTLMVDTTVQPSAMSIRGTGLYHMVTKIPEPLINKEVKHVLDASGNFVYKSPAYYSWTGIREIVRAGKAPQYYPLGSIIYDNFVPSTGTAFQVVAYDKHFDPDLTAQGHTHSMTLAELKITDNVQFCSIQSMLVVETAMPAGTYRFTIPNYDATYGGNKTYVFTTTQQIPVGGCVVLNWQYQQQPKSVSTYATQTDTTALDSNKALTVWDGSSAATDIGTVKLSMSDPDSTYGKLNHIHRARYGTNNYYCSGVRQLINSDANSNAWWQPMDIFDRPYSDRGVSGKLYRLREDMVNVLATTQIESIANTVFETTAIDGTTFTLGTKYSMRDKCFLLSPNEVNLNADTSVGSILDYYVGANNAKRIKYRKDNGNAQHWWLRTPYPSTAGLVRFVYSSGALNGSSAGTTHGCVAACTIQ